MDIDGHDHNHMTFAGAVEIDTDSNTQARLNTSDDSPLNPSHKHKNKTNAKRTRSNIAIFSFFSIILAPVVLFISYILTLSIYQSVWTNYATQRAVVLQAQLSHQAFAPLLINYTLHIPLLNILNTSASFRPSSLPALITTSNDHLTLLHTLTLGALPCALLDSSSSSSSASASPHNPTKIWYTSSAATNASTALGNLDDYYDELLPHYEQLRSSALKSEQALRPPWFKALLCTPNNALVTRYFTDSCPYEGDIERHTRAKARVATTEDGIEAAEHEKSTVARKKEEVRKLEKELTLLGIRLRKEETVGEDDMKHWYFENVALVGGQVWGDFVQEFERLDCARDGAKADLEADGDTMKERNGCKLASKEEEEEEEKRWKVEEIWATS